jgi:biotin operon repressor
MLETSARLLRLLSLLQTPRDWTGTELAERLGVSARTVRNDVDKLRELGYPVLATRGPTGGYRLGAGAAMPPLLLDDEEAVAVAVGLRTAAGGAIAGIEDAALRALAKLEQVLPSRLRSRVGTLQSVITPVPVPGAPLVEPDVLTAIAAACRSRERLRFWYLSHDGTRSDREDLAGKPTATARRELLGEQPGCLLLQWVCVAPGLGAAESAGRARYLEAVGVDEAALRPVRDNPGGCDLQWRDPRAASALRGRRRAAGSAIGTAPSNRVPCRRGW